MDTSQYLELFIDETQEHLQSLNEHILELEKEPEDTDTINEIFRAAHTLKGMAGTMGYTRMQRLTHDLENVFQEFHPQVVFHAAAHKHVPLMEHQPEEAIYNNVFGSYNVGDLAGRYHCERLVLISTDKAVNPTSVMGATKRVTEMVMQALNLRYPETKYVAVRFGNVLGSRGSVVPLFKKQIAAGGPLTVTDPEMKRYFMTIPEASKLVLSAAALGDGGEVFVLNMGEPVKIVDLARNMIRLSGLVPDKDIQIKFTGLRPGEKLFEELLAAEDGTVSTDNKLIFKAVIKAPDETVFWERIKELIRCEEADRCIALLKELIPTYQPNHF